MPTFEQACQEINTIIPIRWWGKGSIRSGYIEPISSPITFGVDKAQQFYTLSAKYGFHAVDSIPSGSIAFRVFRSSSPQYFDSGELI